MNKLARTFVAVVLLTLLFSSATACGPFSMEAVFVYTVHPAYPLTQFARGEIGIVQPSYARSYLYVAYRYLNSTPLSPQEQKAVTELWNERLNNSYGLGEESMVKTWLDARQKVPSLPEAKIDVFRSREKPNEYDTYMNCRQDAFESAATTLNERIKRYGVESAVVKTWVDGQDQVFSNCREGQNIPAALDSSADQLAKADRNYQIAAAYFYSTKLDDAQKQFQAITDDSSSPWRITAPYLVARTLVRKASLGPDETKKESLSQAETQLKKVLADKKLSSTHSAASRLLNLVQVRLRPMERLHELAHVLARETPTNELKQNLWDYTILLDGVLESEEPAKDAKAKEDLRSDDLSDWIATLQSGSNNDLQHSLARWEATHSPAWLVAVLSKIDGKNSKAAELIRQAMNVKSNSAAFASARFHGVRLLTESGKFDEARTVLDQLLKSSRNQLDASSLNLLMSQRMMLATSLSDFLSYVPKVPATLSWNDDGRESPTEPGDVADENKKLLGKPLFDDSAAKVLNTQLPLIMLKEATTVQSLPVPLRRDLTQAAWMRAVLLGDYNTADELVPTLKSLAPELSNGLDRFLIAATPDDRKFSGLFVWLKTPGIEPVVDVGIGRESALNQQDTYRDNWWCNAYMNDAETGPATEDESEITSFTSSSLTTPVFLTDTQKASGAKEWAALRALGTMPNYLSKQVIQWANKNPTDPRVPEALHLAVNSTRFGCGDKDTGRWSKAAFDLLHRKYPTTSWAKKTKYWFKE